MSLNYPKTEEDIKMYNDTLQKLVDSMARMEGEKSLQKQFKEDLKDAYDAAPAKVQKLAKALFMESVGDVLEEAEEITTVFDQIKGEVQ